MANRWFPRTTNGTNTWSPITVGATVPTEVGHADVTFVSANSGRLSVSMSWAGAVQPPNLGPMKWFPGFYIHSNVSNDSLLNETTKALMDQFASTGERISPYFRGWYVKTPISALVVGGQWNAQKLLDQLEYANNWRHKDDGLDKPAEPKKIGIVIKPDGEIKWNESVKVTPSVRIIAAQRIVRRNRVFLRCVTGDANGNRQPHGMPNLSMIHFQGTFAEPDWNQSVPMRVVRGFKPTPDENGSVLYGDVKPDEFEVCYFGGGDANYVVPSYTTSPVVPAGGLAFKYSVPTYTPFAPSVIDHAFVTKWAEGNSWSGFLRFDRPEAYAAIKELDREIAAKCDTHDAFAYVCTEELRGYYMFEDHYDEKVHVDTIVERARSWKELYKFTPVFFYMNNWPDTTYGTTSEKIRDYLPRVLIEDVGVNTGQPDIYTNNSSCTEASQNGFGVKCPYPHTDAKMNIYKREWYGSDDGSTPVLNGRSANCESSGWAGYVVRMTPLASGNVWGTGTTGFNNYLNYAVNRARVGFISFQPMYDKFPNTVGFNWEHVKARVVALGKQNGPHTSTWTQRPRNVRG